MNITLIEITYENHTSKSIIEIEYNSYTNEIY